MKEDLKVVITGTVECLKECGLLDSFYQNDVISLTPQNKQLLCDKMAENQQLAQALVRMGQQKANAGNGSIRLPLLKKDE